MAALAHPLFIDPSGVHDFGCIDARRKRLEEHDKSTEITITKAPYQQSWSPYMDNGGSAIGMAGKGYALVAGDMRMSQGYSVLSRTTTKIVKLSDRVVLATCGMQSDRDTLHKNLAVKREMYETRNNGKIPNVHAFAQLLSTMLYYRRFFPLYCFNLLAGVDENDQGYIYGYDAVGCTEKQTHGACGSGRDMLEPYLDFRVIKMHEPGYNGEYTPPSLEEAIQTVKTAFLAAAERDIYTGDDVEILIVTKDGVKLEKFPTRRD